MPLDRRTFLKAGSGLLAGLSLGQGQRQTRAADSSPIPVRAITRGPKFHWFGYYDKREFDHTNRFVLSNEVDFEHRTPAAGDVINVGMVDLQDQDKWIELGQSNAWCWQQGCMLQWRPGTSSEVVWNDREGDHFVCRVLNTQTRQQRTIPAPVYTLSADGTFALSADFSRIQAMRPGYGYVGIPDPHGDKIAPKDSGVFRVDMESGRKELMLSLADISRIPFQGGSIADNWHWFNHLLIGPDSRRFVVLNRWRPRDPQTGAPVGKSWSTRMVTGNVDGSDISILKLPGMISHFVWKDPESLCMWTRPEGKPAGFYVVNSRTSETEQIGAGLMPVDGHNTYVPHHSGWILCDAYPNKKREQVPYLYHQPSHRRVDLGAFYSPPEYRGEWRCDTHPRTSNDGRLVVIDSPHQHGRQLHLIDISGIIGA